MNTKTLISATLAVGFALGASACMTFIAGKKVSTTGHVIVGHNEDDWPPFTIHHGMLPARDWSAGTMLPATKGCCARIPQVPHTLACYWGEVKFETGDLNADTFLNEKGVIVVSDSGGSSTESMGDPTLLTEGGVRFNLRRSVGERATSARDGVRILCELVEKYGYAPSARIYTIADRDEAWLVQVVHGRNYVAVRCPDDAVTVMPNLYTVYELDAFPAADVIASHDLVENAKRKGFWDGKGKFNFAKAYQGSYNYGPERAFEHPNNTGRFRQAIRLLTGAEWPEGKPFPFSVKPAKGSFSVEDMRAILTAHNGPLKDGKHVLETWSICSSTTIESTICEFTDTPRDTVYHLALGRGCEKPYLRLKPFAEPLPAEIDESVTAEARLATHVQPMADRTPAREIILPDSFTMLNIIPSMPGREGVAAADAIEFAARTGNPYCLYCLTLHPQGFPASATVDAAVASYRKWAELLRGSAVKPAILLQAIVGHWTSDLAEKKTEPWQRAINVKGKVTRFCPLDPGYRAYIRETGRKLAACAPAAILSDDDVRAFSPDAECTCPLHTAEYNRRTGKNLTPEGLRDLLAHVDRRSADHMAFAELQRDTVLDVVKLLREGIDSVDPSIPSGVCEPGWAWAQRYIADTAHAMAGPNHTAWLRLANGQYFETAPKQTMGGLVLRTMASAERLRNRDVLLLDEADTWPHNLWSKSSVAFHAKLSTSAFVGLKGAKLWYVNVHKGPYRVSRHYTEILERNRGFHSALSAAVRGTSMEGVLIPCHKDYPTFPVTERKGSGTADAEGWVQTVFSWYGVPFRVTEDFSVDGLYALGGAGVVQKLSDEEIRAILAHRVLVDGTAAAALLKRGFGDLMGVEEVTERPLFTGDYNERRGDFLSLPKSSNPTIFRALPGAKTISSFVWKESTFAKSFERVAASGVLFRNRLGGTVATTAYNTRLAPAYLYGSGRQRYVYDLLDALAGAPFENICANGQNVLALTRRAPDGADLLLLENLNYDAADEMLIRRRERPASVEVMSPHGQWKQTDFTFTDGLVRIPCDWPCYGVKVLRFRRP